MTRQSDSSGLLETIIRFAKLHNYIDERCNTIEDRIDELKGLVLQVVTGQQELDADITAVAAQVGTVGTQVGTVGGQVITVAQQITDFLKNIPAVDLTGEHAQLGAMLQQLQGTGDALAQASATLTSASQSLQAASPPAPTP